jgi:hypothetical protein
MWKNEKSRRIIDFTIEAKRAVGRPKLRYMFDVLQKFEEGEDPKVVDCCQR